MRLPRVRLTVRLLLALILVLGCGLGWVAHRAGTQRRAVAQIRRLGGSVSYDFQHAPGNATEPRGPRWLRRLIGDELFQEVVDVDLDGVNLTGADLACLKDFPNLVRLHLNCAELGAEGLGRLGRLKLRRLRVLGLADTGIGDPALADFGAFDQLTTLDVAYNPITDAGLAHLRGLRNLRVLSLGHTPLAGPGLAHLEGLRRLTFVDLRGSGASQKARSELMRAVPGVNVTPSSAGGGMTLSMLRAASRRRPVSSEGPVPR